MPTNPRPSTPNDQEMIDPSHSASPMASPRQPLPTSLASFALTHASSASAPPSPSSPSMLIDDGYPFPPNLISYPLYRKLRRSSLLSLRSVQRTDSQAIGFSPGSGSPVNTVFPSWRDRPGSPLAGAYSNDDDPRKVDDDDNQQRRDAASGDPIMAVDDPPGALSSQNDIDRPSTPPPLGSAFTPSSSSLPIDVPRKPLKPPRLLTLLSEATPQEAEVDSEAKFQRLVASHAELPVSFHPRTPRSARGRFPEEVGDDDDDDEKFSGDFSDEDDILIGGPSAEGSVTDDFRWMSASPAGTGMDVDMQNSYSSPSVMSSAMMSGASTPHATAPHSSGSASNNGGSQNGGYAWRDTPSAGTTSSGRVNKRKHTLDDRFEPYGYPSKRRAVSPSMPNSSHHHHGYHYHHNNNSSTSSPISIPSHVSHSHAPNPVPRSPIGLSMSPFQPGSGPSSRSVHSSPILRPVHRLPGREREREERERAKQVNGAGDGVKKINLGP